jgi:hypothetical protein
LKANSADPCGLHVAGTHQPDGSLPAGLLPTGGLLLPTSGLLLRLLRVVRNLPERKGFQR